MAGESPIGGSMSPGGDVAAPATTTAPVAAPPPRGGGIWGTGRRKTSVARVKITPGEGKITVNRREVEKYFTEEVDRNRVFAPLSITNSRGRFNVQINVRGGGHTGQAGAILLGISRALVKADPQFEPTLRDSGFMSRDARKVERKKYGRRKARRRFQFSKR